MSGAAAKRRDLVVRKPTIAVVVCGYNQASYICDALHSVAAQTYEDFDCVIVDDASQDETAQRIDECLEKLDDKRFRRVGRNENGGQMRAMLTGVDATSGPFIAFLDGDDIWQPDFLERHMEAHLSPAGVAAVSTSDMVVVDKQGVMKIGGFPACRTGDPRRPTARDVVLNVVPGAGGDLVFVEPGVTGWMWSPTSGMVFRRDVVEILRPANPSEIRICADYYWAKGAHLIGGTVRVEQVLGSYRMHGNNGWAASFFLGETSALGDPEPPFIHSVTAALVDRVCTVSDEIAPAINRPQLVERLVHFTGYRRARQLCRSNDEIRRVMGRRISLRGRAYRHGQRMVALARRVRAFIPV